MSEPDGRPSPFRWVALATLLGCARPATQIIVRIHTDMAPGEGLREALVRATRVLGRPIDERSFPTSSYAFPGEVRLVPYDPDDASPVRVEVEARFATPADPRNFTQSAIVRFQEGQTLELYMALARRCTDPQVRSRCQDRGLTCGWSGNGRSGCEPIERGRLPEPTYTGTYGGTDHSCPVCGGACVQISSDPQNCGACGRVCPPPAAGMRATCVGGTCAEVRLDACTWDYGDCNNDARDRCEASLTAVTNCGRCSLVCDARPHADPWCIPDHCLGGDNDNCARCAIRCHAGFDDCDGDADNGCEVSTTADPMNCGGCGRRCALACRDGRCATG